MTYKYDLKVKLGRKVIFHQLFEFTEKEHQTYIKSILEIGGVTGILLELEIEDVFIRTYGNKKYFKEFTKASHSIEIEIEKVAKNYPRILVAGALQEQCYNSVPWGDIVFPQVCKQTELFVDESSKFTFVCKILD